jgi:hypothetical protein
MSAGTLVAYILATVLQLPWHVLLASPWLLAAWLTWRFLRVPRSMTGRVAVFTLLLALGLAPIYGFHASMMPAYILVASSTVHWSLGLLSLALTWVVFFATAFVTTKVRARRNAGAI